MAGEAATSYGVAGTAPVGDPSAHAQSIEQVKRELKIAQELNSLNAGEGFVFPMAPLSVVEPPNTWEPTRASISQPSGRRVETGLSRWR